MSSAKPAPTGGVVPMTRRVMNLAHIATQNARRLPAHPAFIWGEKTLDWAEIDGLDEMGSGEPAAGAASAPVATDSQAITGIAAPAVRNPAS